MATKTMFKDPSEFRSRALREACWGVTVLLGGRCVGIRKIGRSTHTFIEWLKTAEVESGERTGVTTDVAEELSFLERENRELRQAKEILRKASASFAGGSSTACSSDDRLP